MKTRGSGNRKTKIVVYLKMISMNTNEWLISMWQRKSLEKPQLGYLPLGSFSESSECEDNTEPTTLRPSGMVTSLGILSLTPLSKWLEILSATSMSMVMGISLYQCRKFLYKAQRDYVSEFRKFASNINNILARGRKRGNWNYVFMIYVCRIYQCILI